MDRMELNDAIHFDERLRLNFDWGWGRYEFYGEGLGGQKVYNSWVGIPPVGVHPCNFFPMEGKSTEEELKRHKEAIQQAGGCP